MDTRQAQNFVLQLRGYQPYEQNVDGSYAGDPDDLIARGLTKQLDDGDGVELMEKGWVDSLHIATTCFRSGVAEMLTRDHHSDHAGIVLVEIFLTEQLPVIEDFSGIFAVDDVGIWYYDGDGHIDEPVWRQRVILWRFVQSMVLHQVS